MDPDDGDGFGGLVRRRNNGSAIQDAIARPNMDEFFGCLSQLFGRARDAHVSGTENCSDESEHDPCGQQWMVWRQNRSRHRDLPPAI